MADRRPARCRALLDLLGADADPAAAGLDEADWAALDELAAANRLQPRLHALHRDQPAIPAAIRANWQAAHRHGAILALSQQAELAECCALLEAEGFAPVALKGAWLARHAYPHPAERPLRDIDLLLDPASVIPAFERLVAAGYRPGQPPTGPLADAIVRFRHLPVLVAPRGTHVELHQWLWEAATGPAGAVAGIAEARMRAQAVVRDGVRYPAPADLLDHLVIHALYSHHLDCGPLVLPDLALLADSAPIDWADWWSRARAGGWAAGAALLFALAHRYHGPSALPASAPDGLAPDRAILEAAAALLLPLPGGTGAAQGMGQALQDGSRGLIARFRGLATPYDGTFVRWLASRTLRHAPRLLSHRFRAQARDHARLTAWLDRR